MFLTHYTDPDLKNIINLLDSGYLVAGCASKISNHQYIFLMLEGHDKFPSLTSKYGAVLTFDIRLLLHTTFYLNVGLHGEVDKSSIKVRTTNEKELYSILTTYLDTIYTKYKNKDNFYHEILVKKIDLKYLLKITLRYTKDKNKNDLKQIKRNFIVEIL